MAKSPHGFLPTEHPYIKLTPYKPGLAHATTGDEVTKKFKDILNYLLKDTKSSFNIAKKVQGFNKQYYGSVPDTEKEVYIPITESFKMQAENSYSTIDPFSAFHGSVGGAAALVGANVMGINNIVGKLWTGSDINIGNFSFNVAVDTSIPLEDVRVAAERNYEYIKNLKNLFFVKRLINDIGVMSPPAFCQLTSSWVDFERKYVGIKNLNIETFGMWDGPESPISYVVTLELEDMVLGLTSDHADEATPRPSPSLGSTLPKFQPGTAKVPTGGSTLPKFQPGTAKVPTGGEFSGEV